MIKFLIINSLLVKLNLKKHPEKYFEIDGNSHRLAYEVMPLD